MDGGPPPGHLAVNGSITVPIVPGNYSGVISLPSLNVESFLEQRRTPDLIEGNYVGYEKIAFLYLSN